MNETHKQWNDKLEEFCQIWLDGDGDYETLTMGEFLKHMRHEENMQVLNRIASSLEKLVETKTTP